MRKQKLWLAIIPILLLSFGCNDGTVIPFKEPGLVELAGEWEARSIIIDSTEHLLPAGDSFWCFSETGQFCTMWFISDGVYYPGQFGQVTQTDLVLSDNFHGDQVKWQLMLSANLDTLHVFLIEPDSIFVDSWLLERAANAPEPTCFFN
ncbi:hypothetical protein HN388_00270 [bacterium]|nr:hypothetical protein [bacterium]MBT4360966.1 hypothetical protein [Candidatus Neomarinimicrobiota bacterium]MBT7311308.1 hypothetical protein [bacterium]